MKSNSDREEICGIEFTTVKTSKKTLTLTPKIIPNVRHSVGQFVKGMQATILHTSHYCTVHVWHH